jgi:HK97 family phage major capsid protein
LYEESQLLSGTGANHQLNGLITQATAYTVESPNLTNEIDIIRDAITQAQVGEYRPNFLVLNPSDWDSIERRKVSGSDDRYVVGDPANGLLAPRLWGLPVVVTNSISAGTFLLGDANGCAIYDREQAAVTISYEEGNNFTKNMVTVLAEERLALCVHRTEAFITGSL